MGLGIIIFIWSILLIYFYVLNHQEYLVLSNDV